MTESDLSEGFGFKPGSLSEAKFVDKSVLINDDGNSDLHGKEKSDHICALQDDFQTLKQVLQSKYDAINILKNISNNTNIERMVLEKHLLEITIIFKNEIVKLQDELEISKTIFYENLKIWTARFKELDKECSVLKEELMKKSKCIENLTADNIKLLKEKQRFINLLSNDENLENKSLNHGISKDQNLIKLEKIKFNKILKRKNFVKYHSFDNYPFLLKLSTCKCERSQIEGKLDESYIMVEAYKLAFEELLAKNRDLILKFSSNDNSIQSSK